jgi:hypothetical protein
LTSDKLKRESHDIFDAIRSLKINSALPITNAFFENSDINGDNKFSMVESIFYYANDFYEIKFFNKEDKIVRVKY